MVMERTYQRSSHIQQKIYHHNNGVLKATRSRSHGEVGKDVTQSMEWGTHEDVQQGEVSGNRTLGHEYIFHHGKDPYCDEKHHTSRKEVSHDKESDLLKNMGFIFQ